MVFLIIKRGSNVVLLCFVSFWTPFHQVHQQSASEYLPPSIGDGPSKPALN